MSDYIYPYTERRTPADTWLWQVGNNWVAVVGAWEILGWWDGATQDDIEARPNVWARHILDVPASGTLSYRDAFGIEREVPANLFK